MTPQQRMRDAELTRTLARAGSECQLRVTDLGAVLEAHFCGIHARIPMPCLVARENPGRECSGPSPQAGTLEQKVWQCFRDGREDCLLHCK
jgi:hypothetical protein